MGPTPVAGFTFTLERTLAMTPASRFDFRRSRSGTADVRADAGGAVTSRWLLWGRLIEG